MPGKRVKRKSKKEYNASVDRAKARRAVKAKAEEVKKTEEAYAASHPKSYKNTHEGVKFKGTAKPTGAAKPRTKAEAEAKMKKDADDFGKKRVFTSSKAQEADRMKEGGKHLDTTGKRSIHKKGDAEWISGEDTKHVKKSAYKIGGKKEKTGDVKGIGVKDSYGTSVSKTHPDGKNVWNPKTKSWESSVSSDVNTKAVKGKKGRQNVPGKVFESTAKSKEQREADRLTDPKPTSKEVKKAQKKERRRVKRKR